MGDFVYSVEVSNKFAFDIDDDDDDPIEILNRQLAKSKEEKAAKKNAEKTTKKETVPAKKLPVGKKEPTIVEKPSTIEAAGKRDNRARRPPRSSNNADQERNSVNTENRGPPPKRFYNNRGDRGSESLNREGQEARESGDRDVREGSGFHRDNRENREGISNRYRGNRGGPWEDRPPRENRDGTNRAPRNSYEGKDTHPAEERERTEGSYGRGRGSRSYVRGGRGRGIPSDRRPRHEFERRSGSDRTGVKVVDKKDGGGAHNWGTVQDDVESSEKPSNDTGASTEDTNQDWASQVEAENQSSGLTADSAETVQEKVEEMTLEEYRSLQTKQRVQAPAFSLRKANEGVDNAQWKKMVVLAKPKDSNHESEEEVEEEEEDEPQPQKNLLNIEFRFSDSPRRGGRGRRDGPSERGGRPDRYDRYDDRPGGYRGGRIGRGAERGARGSRMAAAPNVMDERDFPSLVRAS